MSVFHIIDLGLVVLLVIARRLRMGGKSATVLYILWMAVSGKGSRWKGPANFSMNLVI